LVTTLLFNGVCISAQDKVDTIPDGWRNGGLVAVSFSQVSLTNWAAGGENSIAGNGIVNFYLNYKKGKSTWDNNLDLGYGLIKPGDEDMRKNEDKIDLTSKYGYLINKKHWYATVLFNFKSQFAEGYAYPNDSIPISKFAAPAYFLFAIGMDHKPNDHFSFFISPATAKVTLVNDQDLANAGAFGVEPAEFDTSGNVVIDGEKTRFELGAFVKVMYTRDIVQNVNLLTKFDLYSNYLEEPQNVDVSWEVFLSMKINKFLTATLNTHLLYDHDVPVPIFEEINGVKTQTGTGPRTQFKEVFGLGFSYKFGS
jgi:hypothetical protein